MRNKTSVAMLLLVAFTGACKEDNTNQALPEAIALTDEAAGFYCQMAILEHVGPKAQAHLAGMPAPLWFSQVRDGIAYLKSPEKEGDVLALYVNDMGKATSWDAPGTDNWIDVNEAWFVVGSDAKGGMGVPEIVPFEDQQKAAEFSTRHGGDVLTLDEISVETVLAPVEFDALGPEITQ